MKDATTGPAGAYAARMPASSKARPVSLALANDHQLVVLGLAEMLAPFADRVTLVEAVAGADVTTQVDVTLYDTFSQPQVDADDFDRVIAGDCAGRVVIFTWNVQRELVEMALRKGASGYLSKRLTGAELVAAIERIHAGEVVVSADDAGEAPAGGRWPGQAQGLTVREAEVIALITLGLSNKQIASQAYLSINSVKSYIRSAYRKMGVATRSQAVLWAVHHGFEPASMRFRAAPESESTA